MTNVKALKAGLVLAAILLSASALTARIKSRALSALAGEAESAFPPGQSAAASSLPAEVLLNPEDLAKLLQSSTGEKPLLIQVGFRLLYSQAHIPGSEYIGPASQPEALEKLQQRVEHLARKKFIVLYCGCRPWNHCPTVRPAFEALHNMGFTKVKVLFVPNNFGQDWIARGYPVEKWQ